MWLLSTSIAFITWALVSIFYKATNKVDEYTHLKTGILVGLIMGGHALVYMLYKGLSINMLDVVKYFPISVMYIASMIVGYRGYKYIELSISSPVQNSSGVITALLFVLFFHEVYDYPFYIAVILIFIGVIGLSLDEVKENKEKRKSFLKQNGFKKLFTLAIMFPLFYALFDGVGTFLDGVFLDKLELINPDSALISYEFTFLAYGIVTWIYLKKKEPKIKIFDEWNLIAAAICEMVGQVFYVFAMAENATIAAPIIGSYCVMTMLLSRVFLKEKLTKKEYLFIFLVLVGVIILAIMDV
mgnify:CR=1 FL=1